MTNYYYKYLKYKQKYLQAKNQSGGNILIGTVNKIFYCGFSIVVRLENGSQKVIYVQKFPPASGTTSPIMANPTLNPEELKADVQTRDEMIAFWNHPASRQVNGEWKGGEWGSNNLVTTDATWLTGTFIGDTIRCEIIADGIIKFNGSNEFAAETAIIAGTENKALSCNIALNGRKYSCYLTDQVMPQVAIDVLFVYKNKQNKKFIKLLKRGEGANVDMPKRIMPGAGEHLEPGLDPTFKAGILRAVQEEIGIPPETLSQCYVLNVGVFNDPGRDPRYWSYSYPRENASDGKRSKSVINFGINRGSQSNAYILYINMDSDAEPREDASPLDTVEVNKKWWHPLDQVFRIPEDKWMIIDHHKIVDRASRALDEFDRLSLAEKETKLLRL
jgi:ADP-ribose pyrophosphatase YjhB (NUDIX family)